MMDLDIVMGRSIAEVIKEYPEIGIILEENGVGCVSCSVGTCLLKDVLKIHYMPDKQAHEVMKKIELILLGEEELHGMENTVAEAAVVLDPGGTPDRGIGLSERLEAGPLRELIREHEYIKKVLEIIPQICRGFSEAGKVDPLLLGEIVGFIRNYADKFHHAKEENILFRYAPEGFAPIKAMLEEHERGRIFVRNAMEAGASGDVRTVAVNLKAYMELLQDHIKREDEVLYPWFGRSMTEAQLEEMEEDFKRVDGSFGENYGADYEQWCDEVYDSTKLSAVKSYRYMSSDRKLIEKLIGNEDVAINHMILPPGEKIEAHQASTNVYFVIIKGSIRIALNGNPPKTFSKGEIVTLPKGILMGLENQGTENYEMFIVRVPNE